MKRNTKLRIRSLGEMARVVLDAMFMKRRLMWLGHIERMDNSRLPKYFLLCKTANESR